MSYRKTVSLVPSAAMKLKAAAERYGLNDTKALELAIDLLDRVDKVRKAAPVVTMGIESPGQQVVSKDIYFNG